MCSCKLQWEMMQETMNESVVVWLLQKELDKEETGACGVHRFYMKKIYYEKEILVNVFAYE